MEPNLQIRVEKKWKVYKYYNLQSPNQQVETNSD